jgi:hypothetical protein
MERRETPAYLEADRAWSGGVHQHLHELLSVLRQKKRTAFCRWSGASGGLGDPFSGSGTGEGEQHGQDGAPRR